MYTEEYEHKGFPFKDFIIKLILVIILIVLLIWLIPKFISSGTVVNENSNIGNNGGNNSSSSVNASTSQKFEDNLKKMKEAALSYYTEDKLPASVGEYKTMTLGEMIEAKIISPLKDRNNKNCDTEKSYIRITKLEEEYILKINLKDSEKEDYILVHLGKYTYCANTLCEKDESKEDSTQGVKSSSSNPSNSIVAISPSNNGSTGTKKSATANENKENSSSVVANIGSSSSSTGKKSSNEGKSSSSTSSSSSTGKSSSGSSSSSKNPADTTPAEGQLANKGAYLYEYSKSTNTKFSAWTSWSNWTKTSCDTKEVNCSDDDLTCLKKVQLYSQKEQIGTYDKKYLQTRETVKQTGSYEVRACSNYDYVIIDKTTYATTTTTTYNTINSVTTTKSGDSTCSSGSSSLCSSWSGPVKECFTNPPKSTSTTYYKFAGASYDNCSDTCYSMPKFCYFKYTYKGSMNNSIVKITTPGYTTSDSSTTVTSSSTISVSASCGSYVTKTIPIYSTITVNDIALREEPLYGTVCYQSSKTRSLLENGSSDVVWSKYDDKSLLNAGYKYTGKKKAI